jgi:hypothetical protein
MNEEQRKTTTQSTNPFPAANQVTSQNMNTSCCLKSYEEFNPTGMKSEMIIKSTDEINGNKNNSWNSSKKVFGTGNSVKVRFTEKPKIR